MKRAGRKQIAMADMLEAIETARMGELNGTESPMTADERKRIAVHEAGHAIVAAVLGAGRVEKVTILPRGSALGVTLVTPHEDKKLHVKSDMENHIQVLLGGRNAELAVLNEASNGASQDLKEASRLAMDMVGRHGFGQEGKLFSVDALPEQFAAFRAESMVKEADQVLQEQNKRCQLVLGTYRLALDALTAELLDCETVSGERVLELLQPDAVAA
jgi:cell division protease FtsH